MHSDNEVCSINRWLLRILSLTQLESAPSSVPPGYPPCLLGRNYTTPFSSKAIRHALPLALQYRFLTIPAIFCSASWRQPFRRFP